MRAVLRRFMEHFILVCFCGVVRRVCRSVTSGVSLHRTRVRSREQVFGVLKKLRDADRAILSGIADDEKYARGSSSS